MIHRLSLNDPDIVRQIWLMQLQSYRLEAELIGLKDAPPLVETPYTLAHCEEAFYGLLSEDGELLGAIAVKDENEGHEITRLMVHPDHLREGIGKQLVKHALQVSFHEKETVFTVTAGTRNKPAISLYQSFGFSPIRSYEAVPNVELTVFELPATK